MPKPPSRRAPSARLPVLPFLTALAMLLSSCGGKSGLAQFVADDCTTTPDQLARARKSLRNTGLARCADPATCDDAFVLAELSKVAACGPVSLAGTQGSPNSRSPNTPNNPALAQGPTTVHILFEASASMHAYLAQQAGLKDHLLDVIQRLQSPTGRAADALALYYIGQNTAPYSGQPMAFVSTLSPTRLPKVGSSTSDIADLVRAAFAKTSSADAVVLVSDYVFSPGRGVDATQYLAQQSIVIRDLVQRQLQRDADFSVGLVAAESSFDGVYYDRNNKTYRFRGQRPYYYLVAGPRRLVLDVTDHVSAATGGSVAFFSPAGLKAPLAIDAPLANRSQGSFRVDDKADAPTLTDAKAAIGGPNSGSLLVNVRADLNGLSDATAAVRRAQLSDNFELVDVTELGSGERPYTHRLTLRRVGKQQYPGTIRIELPRSGAGDLSARYLADDVADPSKFAGKTFGLQQLVAGIEDAFAPYQASPAATLTFTIQ